ARPARHGEKRSEFYSRCALPISTHQSNRRRRTTQEKRSTQKKWIGLSLLRNIFAALSCRNLPHKQQALQCSPHYQWVISTIHFQAPQKKDHHNQQYHQVHRPPCHCQRRAALYHQRLHKTERITVKNKKKQSDQQIDRAP